MSDRPNVLLISTDHWPASLLGCAGHPVVQTPTLDELARCGTRFANCYAECPVCIPARRTLMTGTTPRTHGDRCFDETRYMPDVPTMAQTFREAGYQAYAVGKLHVYPPRDRIGFDDVILDEEGRAQFGSTDDYELFLGDCGYAGQQFGHYMSNNDYVTRPWHLPEHTHPTNWVTQQMTRMMIRRDPKRPCFWFASYRHPHPPLTPLQQYLDLYKDAEIDTPYSGSWVDYDKLPYTLQADISRWEKNKAYQTMMGRRSFYALCTHIDHAIRALIGTLREEGLLNNTIICFTSDHGDMLGNHGQWAKRLFFEDSANIPMILVGTAKSDRVGVDYVDDRLVGWQDVMPTLLDLAGIDIPDTVEGISMVGEKKRDMFYGEVNEDDFASRMIHDGRFKLIYYPVGNHYQLFDMEADPKELTDLASDPAHAETLSRLTDSLIGQLYGSDEAWLQDGKLIGLPGKTYRHKPNRQLSGQRGTHWPPPAESVKQKSFQ